MSESSAPYVACATEEREMNHRLHSWHNYFEIDRQRTETRKMELRDLRTMSHNAERERTDATVRRTRNSKTSDQIVRQMGTLRNVRASIRKELKK